MSRRIILATLAVLLLPFVAAADYLEVRRTATLKASADSDGTVVARPAIGTLLALVANEQTNGYYRARELDGTAGWIYRTLVRRFPGSIPGQPTDNNIPAVTNITPPSGPDLPFKVHFLDVGTGDAAIIDMGDREVIIDGGNSPTVLTNYVRQNNLIDGPIELVVVTHGDMDHWRGIERLMNFDGKNPNPPKVLEFWDAGYNRDCNPPTQGGRVKYRQFIDRFQGLSGIQIRRPLAQFRRPADETNEVEPFSLPSLPGMTFTILHSAANPTSDNTECSYLINNASIVMKVQIGTSTFLFTGDANGKERKATDASVAGHVEDALLRLEAQRPGTLKADVLKVPHHGSETASTEPFIRKVNPEYAIISASTSHHLPKDTVVERYEDGDRLILRTDQDQRLNNDHVLCMKEVGAPLSCDYEATLNE